MTSWIYETPDNGKTVFRREMNNHVASKELEVEMNIWFSIEELKQFGKFKARQEHLHNSFPMLKELWQEYQMMFAMIDNGNTLDKLK